jgi:flavin-dependent dehydrogenase
MTSVSVDRVDQRPGQVEVPAANLHSRYLVAADGADSSIAKQLKLGSNRRWLVGAEYETDGFNELEDDKLHVFLSNRYAPGYIGWLIKGVDQVQIGVAAKQGVNVKLRPFFDFLKVYFGTDAQMVSGRGGRIPCGGVVSPWARDNVCLLGDAAGMVSPLTAGGIHSGIETGQLLGRAVARHLLDGEVLPQQQIATLVKRYPFKRQLRAMYSMTPPSDALMNRLIGNALFRRFAQIVFFHNRGLLSKQVWRDVLFSEAYSS